MTDATVDGAARADKGSSKAPLMFGITVFASAALIFLVEPMVAKLVLPRLGGSPMVWNTCMAFFQAALLVGYAYAHLLQRVKSLRTQIILHGVVLLLALASLPLRVTGLFGEPGALAPGLWLVLVLAISIGGPFAALSATAPLAQAWYARVRQGQSDANNPYVLYAASNLGSLIALLAYPIIVEPTLTVNAQTWSWSGGYLLFVLVILLTAFSTSKSASDPLPKPVPAAGARSVITWTERLIWIGLAAAPSSLMLGVTTHLTLDIASTPFLWVLPLSLYLITFIIAFGSRRIFTPFYILVLQAAFVVMAAFFVSFRMPTFASWAFLIDLAVPVVAFFFTALMCHSALAERRPDPAHLTEFYLLMSLGGVIGGAFNAFVAPIVFQTVIEYPVVLVLACLARPWALGGRLKAWELLCVVLIVVPTILIVVMYRYYEVMPEPLQAFARQDMIVRFMLIAAVVSTFLIRDRGLIFTISVGLVLLASHGMGGKPDIIKTDRSFFGVLKLTRVPLDGFSNEVRVLANGTTLHGVQFTEPSLACTPRVYYAPSTPIGQVFTTARQTHPNLTVGAVGMGTGSVAGFSLNPGDVTRFFEIDQDVVDMATNPKYLTYIHGCAKGKIDWVLGDARLKLQDEPNNKFDILLVDAFSSDAVPAHLLTRQAMQLYLSKIKPDGVVIMHLSNRHLDLMSPVAATAKAAGGFALEQYYPGDPELAGSYIDSPEQAVIIGRNQAALAAYVADARWTPANARGVRQWTDDYTNIFGAMVRSLQGIN